MGYDIDEWWLGKKLWQWVKITKITEKIEMFLGKLRTLRGPNIEIEIFNTAAACLLVIGTFQTGYCRVYTDRKLLARGQRCLKITISASQMCNVMMPPYLQTMPVQDSDGGGGQKPLWLYFLAFLCDFVTRARARIPVTPWWFLPHVIPPRSEKCFHSLTKVSLFTQCLH